MESINVGDYIIQYNYDAVKCSLKNNKKVIYFYYINFIIFVIGCFLGIYATVNFQRIDICFMILPTLLMGISFFGLYEGDVCKKFNNMRNGERLIKMIVLGDKILDIQITYDKIWFVVEHRCYGEEKNTFALSKEAFIFSYKKMYTTDNESTVININNAVIIIPYLEEV